MCHYNIAQHNFNYTLQLMGFENNRRHYKHTQRNLTDSGAYYDASRKSLDLIKHIK